MMLRERAVEHIVFGICGFCQTHLAVTHAQYGRGPERFEMELCWPCLRRIREVVRD